MDIRGIKFIKLLKADNYFRSTYYDIYAAMMETALKQVNKEQF